MMAVRATGLALLISLSSRTALFYAVLVFVIVAFAFAFWFMNRDILKAAQRIQEIELDINDRAGEDILVWENLYGGGATGWWGPARPSPRTALSTRKPPERTFRGDRLTARQE
jgi:hypothetical protein